MLQVKTAIDRMPPRQQEMLHLLLAGRGNMYEVGELMGIPKRTAKAYSSYIQKHLRAKSMVHAVVITAAAYGFGHARQIFPFAL